MSDEPRERCSHQDSKGKRRVKSECGYCQRDLEIVRLRAENERLREIADHPLVRICIGMNPHIIEALALDREVQP